MATQEDDVSCPPAVMNFLEPDYFGLRGSWSCNVVFFAVQTIGSTPGEHSVYSDAGAARKH
jgi:hypothetical protein